MFTLPAWQQSIPWTNYLETSPSTSPALTLGAVQNGDAYGFAKVSAERLVRDHVGQGSKSYDFVTLNPSVILGPCLCKQHTKSSAVVVRQFLYGNAQPNYCAQFVDVRDVAAAHCLALTIDGEAVNSRFIIASDPKMRILDLEAPLQKLFPNYIIKGKATNNGLVTFLSYIPLLGNLIMKPFQKTFLSSSYSFQNTKSKEVLKLQYRPLDDTLRDTVTSMVDTGYVKAQTR